MSRPRPPAGRAPHPPAFSPAPRRAGARRRLAARWLPGSQALPSPRRRRGAGSEALLLLLLAACRPADRDAPPAPAAPPSAPVASPAGRPALAWGRLSGSSGYTSLWLDAAGAEQERRAGLWLPAPGRPVALRVEAEERPGPACPSGATPFARAVWQRAALVAPDGVAVAVALPGERAVERQVEPVTSHEGRLVVRVAEVVEPCADPPRYRVSAVSVAPATGAAVVEASDEAPGAPAVRAWLDARRALALGPWQPALARLPPGFVLAGGAPLGAAP